MCVILLSSTHGFANLWVCAPADAHGGFIPAESRLNVVLLRRVGARDVYPVVKLPGALRRLFWISRGSGRALAEHGAGHQIAHDLAGAAIDALDTGVGVEA